MILLKISCTIAAAAARSFPNSCEYTPYVVNVQYFRYPAPLYTVPQSHYRGVGVGRFGDVPPDQYAGFSVEDSGNIEPVCLFSVVGAGDKVEGVVVRNPNVVSFDAVVKAFYVGETVVNASLFALTEKFYNGGGQLIGQTPERPLACHKRQIFGELLEHVIPRQPEAVRDRKLRVAQVQGIEALRDLGGYDGVSLVPPSPTVHKSLQIAVLVRLILAVQDIPAQGDTLLRKIRPAEPLGLGNEYHVALGTVFVFPAAYLPFAEQVGPERDLFPLIGVELAELLFDNGFCVFRFLRHCRFLHLRQA